MAELPLDIVENILLRLPVKSLLRFRCVCKSWCTLISHPQFAKTHLQLLQTQAKTRLCIISFEEKTNDASLVVRVSIKDWESMGGRDLNGGVQAFDYSLSDVNLKHHVHLLNSCDGLLCLVDTLGKFVLWNPSTRQYNPLPPNPTRKCFSYGFGYDSSADDYKIVGVSCLGHETVVDVFSLKLHKWRRMEEKHHTQFVCSWEGTVLHEALHWIAYLPNERHITIVAFDFGKEEFRQMAIPRDDSISMLAVMGGCLCMPCGGDSSQMWVMKEYGVEASWTRMDSPFLDENFKCQPLNKQRKMWVHGGLVLGLFDDVLDKCHDGIKHDANLYVQTLVSPYSSQKE